MAVPVQKKMLTLLVIAAMIVQVTKPATYTVGAPGGGWDLLTDLKTWGSIRTFYVGDHLYFSCLVIHSVLEVTKTDSDSCNTSNPIDYDTNGSTTVPLDSPTTRYFICGTSLHCALGMRVVIATLAQSRTPIAKQPPPPPPKMPWPPTRDSSRIFTGLVIGIAVGGVTGLVVPCHLVILKRRNPSDNSHTPSPETSATLPVDPSWPGDFKQAHGTRCTNMLFIQSRRLTCPVLSHCCAFL